MKYKYLLSLLVAVISLGFLSCSDDNDDQDVGASVQPAGDLLSTYSSTVDVTTESILVDSVLSKNDYLYLGQYSDPRFGATQCEYMSQFDARLDGISLPDITLVDSATMANKIKMGIYEGILNQIDPRFGLISEISDAGNVKVDSAYFIIRFDDEIMGDSTALQAIDIFALTGVLKANARHYSNVRPEDYCDKKTLLGSLTYQIAGKYSEKYADDLETPRLLEVPFDADYASEIVKVYLKDSDVKYQSQFNQKFPGVYVAHSFNEGGIIKVLTSYLLIYYHFDGKIHTTFNGKDTIVDASQLSVNPLQRSLTIACNKSVERVNIFNHPVKSTLAAFLNDEEFTYATSPAGLYTTVDVNYKAIHDSVQQQAGYDSTKIYINSATLKVQANGLNWASAYSKEPTNYMLLIARDSIEDFFYYNRTPDGVNSMRAVYDTAANGYQFDLARAVQLRIKNPETNGHLLENMVLIPMVMTASSESNTYFYHQQFWPTATRLYSSSATDESVRPVVKLVFTKRE